MEEYIETIYRLEQVGIATRTGQVAKELGVAPPSVTDMLQKLEKGGFVTYEPYKGVQLTETGREVGKRILGRHRIMQAFLQEICGMGHKAAHEASCDMEHFIPRELDAWMASHLEKTMGRPFDRDIKVKHQIGSLATR
jgi:DtxR family Mn-dependent transcriptional regulator